MIDKVEKNIYLDKQAHEYRLLDEPDFSFTSVTTLIGNHFEEEKILNLANLYQENSVWHKEFPGELS